MDKCKVIAIANQKGDIDKATEALHIATILKIQNIIFLLIQYVEFNCISQKWNFINFG